MSDNFYCDVGMKAALRAIRRFLVQQLGLKTKDLFTWRVEDFDWLAPHWQDLFTLDELPAFKLDKEQARVVL